MPRLIMLLFVAVGLCGICQSASLCPRCQGMVLPADTFCTKCRWRLSEPYTPPPAQQPPAAQPSSASASSGSSLSRHVPRATSVTPIKLAIVDQLAIPSDRQCSVYGLHLSAIGGQCHTMYGISIAGIGTECVTLGGLSVGLFGMARTSAYGLQIGLINGAQDGLYGCQIGMLNIAGVDTCGIQIGCINCITLKGSQRVLPLLNMQF